MSMVSIPVAIRDMSSMSSISELERLCRYGARGALALERLDCRMYIHG